MEIAIDILMQTILWIVILPLMLFLGTPVILLTSVFKKDTYLNNVKKSYQKLFKYWKDRI